MQLNIPNDPANGSCQPLTLADEYRLAAIENEELIADFVQSDMEGWGEEY